MAHRRQPSTGSPACSPSSWPTSGIVAFNLSPGFIATERIAIDMAEFGFDATKGAPADVVGAVAAWLATVARGSIRNGQWIEAQPLCRELGLLPGWP